MRQTGSTNHQRHGVDKHIERAAGRGGGVFAKAEVSHHRVQFGQQRNIRPGHGGTQSQLRQEITGELQRNKDRRNGVCQDQHDVLRHLGVGDAFHAAKHSIQEDDAHTHVNANITGDAEEARKCHANARHLTNDVRERCSQQAQHRHHAGTLGVKTVANELRDRELAKLAQVRCQQHGQQHVAAGPAHQEQAAAVTHVGDQAGHGDEGRG